MLMSLGTLATIANAHATNLLLFIAQNETYELTGNQTVPGAGKIDFAAMAHDEETITEIESAASAAFVELLEEEQGDA